MEWKNPSPALLRRAPSPRGEGGPLPALSPAGAGRVRGYFGGLQAQSEAIVRRTVLFLRRFGRTDFNLTACNGSVLFNLRTRLEALLIATPPPLRTVPPYEFA